MSNEKLREVVIDLRQKVVELCRLCNCPLPDWSLEQADKALATTEPAVNQQLTTELDEREAFEKWITKNGEWPNNAMRSCLDPDRYANFDIQGLWGAWQARAALAKGVKG